MKIEVYGCEGKKHLIPSSQPSYDFQNFREAVNPPPPHFLACQDLLTPPPPLPPPPLSKTMPCGICISLRDIHKKRYNKSNSMTSW